MLQVLNELVTNAIKFSPRGDDDPAGRATRRHKC